MAPNVTELYKTVAIRRVIYVCICNEAHFVRYRYVSDGVQNLVTCVRYVTVIQI